MQITKNLHAVLEQRKKAMNEPGRRNRRDDEDSDEDGSGNENNESDGSAW
jgi:hypothetical protein